MSATGASVDDEGEALRPGALVRVRSEAEILATLDDDGTLDGVPFMPEMLQFVGKTLPVLQRADKTCNGHGRPRKMDGAVHLAAVRCDGSAHDGCQYGCRIFWKESWLERADGSASPASGPDRSSPPPPEPALSDLIAPATRVSAGDGETVYRCQATAIGEATEPVPIWDPRQYPKDVQNWGVVKTFLDLVRSVVNLFQYLSARHLPRRLRINDGRPYPDVRGPLTRTPAVDHDLAVGDVVRIKTWEEIRQTLDGQGRNRGLAFGREALAYCGRTARISGRVERMIDDATGTMIHITSDCFILDDVACRGDYTRSCTRGLYQFWRPIWLEKISGRDPSTQPT